MRILLSVDGSDYTRRMLHYLAVHPELLGASPDIHIMTIVAPIPTYAMTSFERDRLDMCYVEQAERVLKPVRAFAERQQWVYGASHRAGHAADEIAHAAETGSFDLVVMGSHGHGPWGTVLLGSVSSAVLARCKVPLLLIR